MSFLDDILNGPFNMYEPIYQHIPQYNWKGLITLTKIRNKIRANRRQVFEKAYCLTYLPWRSL